MKHLKHVVVWYLFFLVYVAIFCGLFIGIPEGELYALIYGHSRQVSEVDWDNLHMTFLLTLALIITGICIFSTSVWVERCSSRRGVI